MLWFSNVCADCSYGKLIVVIVCVEFIHVFAYSLPITAGWPLTPHCVAFCIVMLIASFISSTSIIEVSLLLILHTSQLLFIVMEWLINRNPSVINLLLEHHSLNPIILVWIPGMVLGLCNSLAISRVKGVLGGGWGGICSIVVIHHRHSSYLNILHHDISF